MTEAEQAREDLRAVMASDGGARFLRRLLEDCGLYNYNPAGDLMQEGRRTIGLDLRYSLLAVDADRAAEILNQVGVYKEKEDGTGSDEFGL